MHTSKRTSSKTEVAALLLILFSTDCLLTGCSTARGEYPIGWSYSGQRHGRPIYRNALGKEVDRENLQQKVREYIVAHPDRPEHIKRSLISLSVTWGMTRDEVELILGRPNNIVKLTPTARSVADEKWVYNMTGMMMVLFPERYTLFFRDGVLVGSSKTDSSGFYI